MKRLLVVAAILLLLGCTGVKEKQVVVKPMPFLKQAVVMRLDGHYKVVVFFELPNPCHKVRFTGMTIEGHTVTLDFSYTPPKPGEVCIQVVQKYKKIVDLGRLERGTYTVLIRVNGSVAKVLKFTVE